MNRGMGVLDGCGCERCAEFIAVFVLGRDKGEGEG